MSIAIVSAAAAILGSSVGGFISFFAARHVKRQEWQQERIKRQIEKRETLYSEFLSVAGGILTNSVDKKFEMAEFSKLYSVLARVRLLSNDEVVRTANDFGQALLKSYREKAADAKDSDSPSDLRNEFIDACRAEMKALEKN